MRARSAPSQATPSRRPVLTVLFIGVFMAALDTAVVAPAIPALREAFGVDNSQIGMLTIAFSLFSLSSTTLMAAMGDRYGRQPVFLACVAGFAASSLLIALAPSFGLVVLGRALQGFAAGGVTPLASAMVGDLFPPNERGKALGMLGATFGMAFLLGPLVASLILTVLGWQWIFLLNVPVAVVVIWLGLRIIPITRATGPSAPLDWAGIGLIALALSSLVLAINRVLDNALGMTLWPWLLALSVLCIPVLIFVERRAARPVVPLHFFANRQLALTYLLCAGAGFGMGSVVFISSVAVAGLGVAPDRAGMLLIPLVLASSAGSMGFGRLLNSIGSRTVMLIGFGTLCLGTLLLTLTGGMLGAWIFFPASMLIGLGVGIVVGGTLRTIVLNEVAAEERGAAQGLVNVGVSVGNLLVIAILGVFADSNGGGMAGLSIAYMFAGGLMLIMTVLSLGLKPLHEEQTMLAAASD